MLYFPITYLQIIMAVTVYTLYNIYIYTLYIIHIIHYNMYINCKYIYTGIMQDLVVNLLY